MAKNKPAVPVVPIDYRLARACNDAVCAKCKQQGPFVAWVAVLPCCTGGTCCRCFYGQYKTYTLMLWGLN